MEFNPRNFIHVKKITEYKRILTYSYFLWVEQFFWKRLPSYVHVYVSPSVQKNTHLQLQLLRQWNSGRNQWSAVTYIGWKNTKWTVSAAGLATLQSDKPAQEKEGFATQIYVKESTHYKYLKIPFLSTFYAIQVAKLSFIMIFFQNKRSTKLKGTNIC